MANGVANALIEYNLDLRVKPYQDAAEWLSARLAESKAKVEESEKQLQRYREGKGVVSFESKESVITQQLQELRHPARPDRGPQAGGRGQVQPDPLGDRLARSASPPSRTS